MMHKQVLLAIGLLAAACGQAQVTMTPQVPPTGVLLKRQLWNMSLVYTGDNPLNVKLSLTLSREANDQPLLTAVTGTVLLTKGARQLQASDLTPIQYAYLSSVIADHDPDGFLAVGNYSACYTVILADGETAAPLAEDCVSFEVDPLSPPELNTPADESTLMTDYPQFTWIPPSPPNLFYNLTYQFNLVEVQPGQSPADAVQQNLPLYAGQSLSDIYLNYPSANAALDTGKLYAWQVTALNNFQPASQSEVWTFKVAGVNLSVPTDDGAPYVKLIRNQNASEAVCRGIVKFYYTNDAADSSVAYQIINTAESAPEDTVKSGTLALKLGENMIGIPLMDDGRLMDNGTYVLQVVNSRYEVWSMKFMYKEPVMTDNQ